MPRVMLQNPIEVRKLFEKEINYAAIAILNELITRYILF